MREVIGKSVAGVADFLSLGFVHIILKKKKAVTFASGGFQVPYFLWEIS